MRLLIINLPSHPKLSTKTVIFIHLFVLTWDLLYEMSLFVIIITDDGIRIRLLSPKTHHSEMLKSKLSLETIILLITKWTKLENTNYFILSFWANFVVRFFFCWKCCREQVSLCSWYIKRIVNYVSTSIDVFVVVGEFGSDLTFCPFVILSSMLGTRRLIERIMSAFNERSVVNNPMICWIISIMSLPVFILFD